MEVAAQIRREPLSLVFSEELDPASIVQGVVLLQDSSEVAVTKSIQGIDADAQPPGGLEWVYRVPRCDARARGVGGLSFMG